MAICQHQGKGCLVGVNLSAFETFACSWPGTPGEVRAMELTVHLLPAGGGRKQPGDSLGWKCRWCFVLSGCAWGQGGSWLLEVGLVGKPAWLWVSLHAMSQVILGWGQEKRAWSTAASEICAVDQPLLLGLVLRFLPFSDQRMQALVLCL